MAEAAALASAVASHVHAACRALNAADSPEQALSLLLHLAAAYLPPPPPGDEPGQAAPAPRGDADAELVAAAQRLQLAADASGRPAVQAAFWADSFQELAETLLSEVAPRWLHEEPSGPLACALDAFFLRGPASSALSALLAHLASVQPLETPSRQASAAVTAPGALTAARLLTARFARPGAPGIAQLAAGCSQGPDTAAQQAAALLASVPERAAALWQPQLQPVAFVPALVSNLLSSAAGPAKAGFAGAVLARLVRRGFAAQVAAALWTAADSSAGAGDSSPLGWALACVSDSLASERLLEALLTTAAGTRAPEQLQLRRLRDALLSAPQLLAAPSLRYTLTEKLLLHRCLPPAALRLLVSLLAALSEHPAAGVSLAATATAVAQAWASEEGIARLPPPRHACLTAGLLLLLRALGSAGVAAAPGLAAALLAGVGAALDSPLEPIRRQGMRAGNAYAAALGTTELPFDGELGWLPAEAWHPDCAAQGFGLAAAQQVPAEPQAAAAAAAEGAQKEAAAAAAGPREASGSSGGGGSAAAATTAGFQVPGAAGAAGGSRDAAAVGGSSAAAAAAAAAEAQTETDSDDSLQPYAPEGGSSSDEEADLQEGRPLQLRALAEQLGKAGEPQALLGALRAAPLLIQAAPDELPSYAGQLARALLFCSIPDWADAEAASEASKPSALRLRAMAALLERAPRQAGLTLAAEVYSPHLDLSQRLLVLDTLAMAAQQMALPPSRRQPPAAAQAALLAPVADGKTRRWGQRSLARLQRQQQPETFRNSFPAVAVDWTSALLEECGKERHGVDLFGRDALLLARLLLTLGAFVQACAPAPQTAAVAAACLEMLRLAPVHAHAQPLVRQAALLTASQVLRALPPARLAAALADGGPLQRSDGLVERLGWLQGWLAQAAGGDADPEVRALARGCQALQAELASGALASLEAGVVPDSIAAKGPAQLLGLAPGAGPPRLRVQLPDLPGPGL